MGLAAFWLSVISLLHYYATPQDCPPGSPSLLEKYQNLSTNAEKFDFLKALMLDDFQTIVIKPRVLWRRLSENRRPSTQRKGEPVSPGTYTFEGCVRAADLQLPCRGIPGRRTPFGGVAADVQEADSAKVPGRADRAEAERGFASPGPSTMNTCG